MNPIELADFSYKNKTIITSSEKAGCFYCLAIFNTNEVVEYTDNGATAVCPRCGIDSLVASSGCELTPQLLRDANNYWFTSTE